MIDIPFASTRVAYVTQVGEWLEENIPNPPLPEEQIWTIGIDPIRNKFGVRFTNDYYATMFSLKFGEYNDPDKE
jgi:hypothetical protein